MYFFCALYAVVPLASQATSAGAAVNFIFKAAVLEKADQGNTSLSISQKLNVFSKVANSFGRPLGLALTNVEQLPTDPIDEGKYSSGKSW